MFIEKGKKAISIPLLSYILIVLAVLLAVVSIVLIIRLKKISREINTLPTDIRVKTAAQTVKPPEENKKIRPVHAVSRDDDTIYTQDAEQDEDKTVCSAAEKEDNRTVCSPDDARDEDKTVYSPVEQERDETVYSFGAERDDDGTVCSSDEMEDDDRTVYSSEADRDDDRTVYSSKTEKDDDRTVYSSSEAWGDSRFDSDQTVLQPADHSDSAKKPSGKACGAVRLCLLNRSTGESWNLTLRDDHSVIIGRDPACQVCLNEKSVSQYQSVLFIDSAGKLVIENKSQSNITKLNGYDLRSPQVLREGDEIKCGRIVLAAVSLSSL